MEYFNIEAYFNRIGFHESAYPTLETFRRLHRLHPASIPYETIDLLTGRIADLTTAGIVKKLIEQRRGGGCFQQNLLFRRVLATIGFQVDAMFCRPQFGWRSGEMSPRGHMALRVIVDGEAWLADVGFGSWTLTAPAAFGLREAQPTAFEPVRLTPIGEELRLEAWLGGAWRPIYDVLPCAQQDIDLIATHWYGNTHPKSLYRRRLMASITTSIERFALRNNVLTVRQPDGRFEQRTLDASGLETCLGDVFGLAVDDDLRPVLEALAMGSDLDEAAMAPPRFPDEPSTATSF